MIKRTVFLILLLVLPIALFGFHDLAMNGDSVATLDIFEQLQLSGYFDSDTQAIGTIYLDLNNNGVIDPTDGMMMWGHLYDGSWMDVDEIVNGFYEESDTEAPFFSCNIIYKAVDTGGSDQVVGHFLPLSTGYSISGQITYPSNAEGLLVIAMASSHQDGFNVGDITDSGSNYFIGIPDSLINQYWYIFVMDIASAFPNQIEPMFIDSIYVDGAENIDLALFDSDSSCIKGQLKDDLGSSLPDDINIQIMGVWFDIPNLVTGTNFIRTAGGNGDYSGLIHYGAVNSWSVSAGLEELYPHYLIPNEVDTVLSAPQETLQIDLVAYRTDTDIRGTVYLDDIPVDYIQIITECSLGVNHTRSYSDGHYILFVSSSADSYQVYVNEEDIPENGHVEEGEQTVVPGATGVDFHIYSTGIEEKLQQPDFLVRFLPNIPNPFCDRTTITLETNYRTEGELSIYDVTGKCVKTFVRGEFKKGIHRFVWDGRDNNGTLIPSGVYFSKLQTDKLSKSLKLIHFR